MCKKTKRDFFFVNTVYNLYTHCLKKNYPLL